MADINSSVQPVGKNRTRGRLQWVVVSALILMILVAVVSIAIFR